ncbi:hypothetical protein [Streptomyces jumonjinensis]|uniref:Uncharacterized protein n=1 Tax=Streptomyces jumonjinensis TaxID=1945 RepID=A0A646KIM4_STRJU|nr:hypothetical protein [Streptomyces jumonjinensis]MQT02122.1 hypothetical protein [Streptomyces jumonjinensis]
MSRLRTLLKRFGGVPAVRTWQVVVVAAVVCGAAIGGYAVRPSLTPAASAQSGPLPRDLIIDRSSAVKVDDTDNGFHIMGVTPSSIWSELAVGASKRGVAVTYLTPGNEDPYDSSHWIGVYEGSIGASTKVGDWVSWNWATYDCGNYCTATIDLPGVRKGRTYTVVYYDKSDCGTVSCGYKARATYEYTAI